MQFGEWLRNYLVEDEVIDKETLDTMTDPLSAQELIECTELDEDEINNYKTQYEEECQSEGSEPDYGDFEDLY